MLVAAWCLLTLLAHGATPEDQPVLFESYGGFLCERDADSGEWRCEGATEEARSAARERQSTRQQPVPAVKPPVEPALDEAPVRETAARDEVAPASAESLVAPADTEFVPQSDLAGSLWLDGGDVGFCSL